MNSFRYKPSRKLLQQPKWRKEFNILSQNVSLTNYARKTETFARGKSWVFQYFIIFLYPPFLSVTNSCLESFILSMFSFYASFLISIRIISWYFLCLVKSFVGCYENMFTCFLLSCIRHCFWLRHIKMELACLI